jgi:murein DD-endopeptidase MepM/ murein hydrolase activator NlpD
LPILCHFENTGNVTFKAALSINLYALVHGDGQFAYYMHLQPGTLRVKAGEYVRRGQMLARVGCSGDAREPHLHFEVTDSPKLIAGEGLPYVIDRYRTMGAGGGSGTLRTRELPMNNNLVEFAGGPEK